MAEDDLRLADLLCALSVPLDLAMAQAPEKSIRSCLVAVDLARRLGLAEPVVSDVYYATLLRHLGCTATAYEETYLFGPHAQAVRPRRNAPMRATGAKRWRCFSRAVEAPASTEPAT